MVTDLVEAVRHSEADAERRCIQRMNATHYPTSTSAGFKLTYKRDHPKDGQDNRNKNNHGNRGVINAKPVQVESESNGDKEDPEEAEHQRIGDENALWQDGYYICTLAKADASNLFYNACYNCWEEGHWWRERTKPLCPAYQKGPKGALPAPPAKPQK